MKKMKKQLCWLLAALLLLSLAACGKEENADPNHFKLGDYEVVFKSACIMEDTDGKDALVLTLDYINNSKEAASFLWTVSESATQKGTALETATVIADYATYETVLEQQFTDVDPGTALEVRSAFVLNDLTTPVKVRFEQLIGKKYGEITVDPAALSREEAANVGTDVLTTGLPIPQETGDELLDWWNGGWYGWWTMTSCTGGYEEMEGQWWDVCGLIDLDEDYTGTLTLWDEDYSWANPTAWVKVTLNKEGTGPHGTLMSEEGWFTDRPVEHADWIIDPGLVQYENMFHIEADYENGDDTYHYQMFLRPWGTYWDDVEETALPYLYHDWYLPLIEAGEPVQEVIDTTQEGVPLPEEDLEPQPTQDDTDFGMSNPQATGTASLEDMQALFKVLKETRECTYAQARQALGSDGIPWKDMEMTWNANAHSYKWTTPDENEDFLYITFKIQDGDEVYQSCTYSSDVKTGAGY